MQVPNSKTTFSDFEKFKLYKTWKTCIKDLKMTDKLQIPRYINFAQICRKINHPVTISMITDFLWKANCLTRSNKNLKISHYVHQKSR